MRKPLIVLRVFALLLIPGLFGPGCKKQEPAAPPKPDQPTQPTPTAPAPAVPTPPVSVPAVPTSTANPTNNPASSTKTVDQGVDHLLKTFQTAPEPTRTRIQSAVDSIRAGKDREAVVQLKLVDADSALTGEQAQSIKDLINTIRQK